MHGIKHYLIDEFEPDDEFNVNVFQKLTKKYINEIYEKGKTPIIVGGTGFYIQSVLYDIDFDETELDDESTLLLCTDGLSNYVSNDEILELTSDGKHYAFADRLVNKANENGGGDNITAVVISK